MKEFQVLVIDDFGRVIKWQGGKSAVVITKRKHRLRHFEERKYKELSAREEDLHRLSQEIISLIGDSE